MSAIPERECENGLPSVELPGGAADQVARNPFCPRQSPLVLSEHSQLAHSGSKIILMLSRKISLELSYDRLSKYKSNSSTNWRKRL